MKAVIKIIILSVMFIMLACNFFISKPSGGSIVNCLEPPSGLVGWWRGEGDAADSAGQHDGMFINNTTFMPGKIGQAFSFNGVDNLVAIPDSDAWTLGADDFTLDLWANFTAIQSRTALIGHDEGGGSTDKWIFWYDELGDGGTPGPALRFHINSASGSSNPIDVSWAPNIGQWYHLAITRNSSIYGLYIDGKQAATSTNASVIANAAAPLTIGAAEGFFFNGLMDEVHFFSRGLTSSEIQKIFNAGSEGLCIH
jgi:hypothetical protein